MATGYPVAVSFPRLLVLSDGVAKATDQGRRLLGFDRVLELMPTLPTLAKIAETVQAFGQEDDIRVISIARRPIAVPALS